MHHSLQPSAAPSTSAPEAWRGEPLSGLIRLIRGTSRRTVLTGAGCSTDSGIPDYRDAQGAWKRSPPMAYQQFVASHAARQRYWARALIGWRALCGVAPNAAHEVLARLERAGRIDTLITQNVDGLHQRAGSRNVIDLHGRIDAVDCLQCARPWPRELIQARLEQLNPEWHSRQAQIAPDGDALLGETDCAGFQVVDCFECRGILKPAVVFFGESVPEQRVRQAFTAVEAADALLVVGSSLMVFSGYRFVRAARERSIPVAIINLGRTRADAEASLKIEAPCASVLGQLELQLARDPVD